MVSFIWRWRDSRVEDINKDLLWLSTRHLSTVPEAVNYFKTFLPTRRDLNLRTQTVMPVTHNITADRLTAHGGRFTERVFFAKGTPILHSFESNGSCKIVTTDY